MNIDEFTEELVGLQNVIIQSLSDGICRLSKAFEKQRQSLTAERNALQQEKAEFETQKRLMARVNTQTQDRVCLNVGGTRFETSLETVLKEKGSMLHTMFSGQFPLETDGQGAVFIDRSLCDASGEPLTLCMQQAVTLAGGHRQASLHTGAVA